MFDAGIEILGVGVVTVDDLLTVDHIPVRNEKQRIKSATRQCGGLTGTALVAAARLGCRCGYAVALGDGELSSFVRRELAREGVSLVEQPASPEAEPNHSIVVIEEKTGDRTILSNNSKTSPPSIGEAEKDLAARVACLFVDHVFAADLLKITEAARRAGTPVVGDFERDTPGSRELMDRVDHLIIPLAHARRLFGESTSPEEAVRTLARQPGRSLACATDGVRGAWYALGEDPGRVLRQPAFRLDRVVDSTGCGDVFHGVYAAGLVKGWTPAERIRRASAAAALKALMPGAQAGAPTLARLEEFLLTAREEAP